MFARGYAFMTGFDTTFVLFRWHHVSFPFLCCLFRPQRTSRSQIHCTHIARGSFAMGHNPTVDYRGTPAAENGSCRGMHFVAWSDFLFSLALPARRTRPEAHVQVRQQSPRSVRARTMGSGFSTDAVAVQAILDTRPHLFVHRVRNVPYEYSFPLTTKLVVLLSGANYLSAN
jgi:hypothetical protein